MKVYCKNCRYYRFGIINTEFCKAKTFNSRDHLTEYTSYSNPAFFNENNDCSMFERKFSIFQKIKKY